MMAWYSPDSDHTYGKMGARKENCDPASGCCNSPSIFHLINMIKILMVNFINPGTAAALIVLKKWLLTGNNNMMC